MYDKRGFVIKTLFQGLALLGTFALLIGMEWLKPGFDFSLITSFMIYSKIFTSTMLSIISILSASIFYDSQGVSDKLYIAKEKDLHEGSIKLSGNDFDKDIYKLSYSNKKQTHSDNIIYKIEKHKLKQKPKIKQEIHSLDPKDYSKKTLKWLEVLNDYETQLTQEWMDDNLINIKMNYPDIHPHEVLYGSVNKPKKKSVLDRRPLFNRFATKPLSTVGLFFATIMLTAFTETTGEMAVDIMAWLVLIGLTFFNIMMGIYQGKAAHQVRVNNSNTRLDIMSNYKDGVYKQLQDIPKPKYERIEKEIETEEINLFNYNDKE